MAFSQTDFIFSHTVKKATDSNQLVIFSLDLTDLIQLAGHSALFTTDSMMMPIGRERGTRYLSNSQF